MLKACVLVFGPNSYSVSWEVFVDVVVGVVLFCVLFCLLSDPSLGMWTLLNGFVCECFIVYELLWLVSICTIKILQSKKKKKKRQEYTLIKRFDLLWNPVNWHSGWCVWFVTKCSSCFHLHLLIILLFFLPLSAGSSVLSFCFILVYQIVAGMMHPTVHSDGLANRFV